MYFVRFPPLLEVELAGPSDLGIWIPRCPRCRSRNQAGVGCSGFDKSQTIDSAGIGHVLIAYFFLFLLQFGCLVVEIVAVEVLATLPRDSETVGRGVALAPPF